MSPAHHRYVFIGFTLLIAGVTAHVMVMQPAQPVGANGRAGTGTESKAEWDRRQRLALDRSPSQATAQTATKAPSVQQAQIDPELFKAAAAMPEQQPTVPPRVTAGGLQPTASQIPMEQGPRRFARLRPDADRKSVV